MSDQPLEGQLAIDGVPPVEPAVQAVKEDTRKAALEECQRFLDTLPTAEDLLDFIDGMAAFVKYEVCGVDPVVEELGRRVAQAQKQWGDYLGDMVERVAEANVLMDLDEKKLGPFARESETSRKASLMAYPKQGIARHRILQELEKQDAAQTYYSGTVRGPRGLTRDELARSLKMSPNTVRPRVKELIEGGWVARSEHTRKSDAGLDAELLYLTDAARERIEAER